MGNTCPEWGRLVERWSVAIRSVRLEDAGRLHVAGHDEHPVPLADALPFAPEPILAPNTQQERWFLALMLIVTASLKPYGRNERRSCGRALWRGRQHRHVLTAEGEPDRVYVPKESAGGLASRLGCSVRVVDQLFRIARAAGLLNVWQMPKKEAKAGQAGKRYGYAVVRALFELPLQLVRRLSGNRRPDVSPARAEVAPSELAPAAPAPAGGGWTAEDEEYVAQLKRGLLGPSRAPS